MSAIIARMFEGPTKREIRYSAADFDVDWHLRARCRGMPAEVFYTCDHDRGRQRVRHEANAKRICQSCPVLQRCREYAIAAQEPYGIWGATTPKERVSIRQQSTLVAVSRRQPAVFQ